MPILPACARAAHAPQPMACVCGLCHGLQATSACLRSAPRCRRRPPSPPPLPATASSPRPTSPATPQLHLPTPPHLLPPPPSHRHPLPHPQELEARAARGDRALEAERGRTEELQAALAQLRDELAEAEKEGRRKDEILGQISKG